MSFFLIQLLTGLSTAAVLFLVTSGLSLIFGVTRILNFAHGSFYMFGAYGAWTIARHLGTDGAGFWVALPLAALGAGVLGALVEIVVLRRVYASPHLFQLLATFALLLIAQDVTLGLWGPEDLLGPQAPGLEGSITILDRPFPSYDLFLIALAAVLLGGLYLLLHRTRFGVLIRAATEDREMVASLGTNQKWLFTAVFALGSGLAGLGGALQLPRESVSLTMDMSMIIDAFVVVVIGGMGSLRGAALASLIVGLVQAFGILVFPEITLVLLFLVMAVVLVFKPYGLLGQAEDMALEKAQLEAGALRPAPRGARKVWVAAGLVLLILPWFTQPHCFVAGEGGACAFGMAWHLDDYALVLAIEIALFALLASSLHFILGPGGLGIFGFALYFGLGAYAVALLTKYLAASLPLALLAAPAAAVLGALVFGWFCVRSQGIYLAMLTFAFAQMLWAVAFQWYDVTGGDNGILGVWPSGWAADKRVYYYLVMLCCGLSLFALRRALFAPYGYALRAVRDQPLRAEAIGLNGRRLQWAGLGVAGAFAGLAGGLFAYSKGSVFPTTLEIGITLDAFVMTLLGGLGSLSGPALGAGLYTWLKSEVSRGTEVWRLALGVIIISLVIFFPQGIVGSFTRWTANRKRSTT